MAPSHSYKLAGTGDSLDEEERPFINTGLSSKRRMAFLGSNAFNKVMGLVNIVLALVLAFSLALVAMTATKGRNNDAAVASLPFSPARHILQPVTKKFRPSLTFQSDDPEVADPAWNDIQGPVMGYVALDDDTMVKLFEQQGRPTIESPWEPGKWLFAPSMYHQLHCLDILRRSFNRERYFPGVDDAQFNYHRHHCLDFLRQVVTCHADVDMIYWWNRNYTTFNEHREPYQSEWYKSLDIYERFENAEFFWDVDHSCNRLEPLEEWVAENRFFPLGFEGTFNDIHCQTEDCREAERHHFF